LTLPRKLKEWTLTPLRENLIKIGAMAIRHARSITFQLGGWSANTREPRIRASTIDQDGKKWEI